MPIIPSSAAFQDNGLLEITFDEAEQPTLDTTACCGETAGRPPTTAKTASSGPGGGVVGAVLLSPFIKAGTVVTKTSTTTISSLASIEDLFGLPHLGEAQTVTTTFDTGHLQLVDVDRHPAASDSWQGDEPVRERHPSLFAASRTCADAPPCHAEVERPASSVDK